MGNIFDRSAANRAGKSKSKVKKNKRQSSQHLNTSIVDEKFIVQNNNDLQNSPENSYDKHEEWMATMDQHRLSNVNVDPPGAPRTYSTNYPLVQTDSMSRSWSAALDVNNTFYPNTTLPMPTGPSALSHIPAQYNHDYTYFNQPPSIPVEERPSKKVQFARPIEQKMPSSNNPLTATQSWHEPSMTNTNEVAIVPAKQDTLLAKTSLHQSVTQAKNHTSTSSSATAVQKPIYISIDHRATLAERGQIKADNRHHKSTEKSSSTASNHHRSRGHTQQQQQLNRHHESIDPSTSKQSSSSSSNKPLESVNHRSLTTTSTSTTIPNNHEHQTKRSRHSHQSQNQHIEQQVLIENTSTRGNSSQTKQHSRSTNNRPTSPVRNEVIRRVEIKHPIPSAGNPSTSQSQSRTKSSHQTTPSNNITRTRI